jgi:DNA helicase II / ATP-dependent DNA helicase PcrA
MLPSPAAADSDTGFGFGAAATNTEMPASDNQPGGDQDQMHLLDASHFEPSLKRVPPAPKLGPGNEAPIGDEQKSQEAAPDFALRATPPRCPSSSAFIIDRTGYIKALETEGTPEAFSRIENLKELANAAHDAEERGETLADFLDHAALASDTDSSIPTPASRS